MKQSIVNIESTQNNSFGTGFVIYSDSKGVYILTCQHVLDDVVKPVIDNVLAKIIVTSEFIDMAVLYVSKLHIKPLSLQIDECNSLQVDVIGFSSFNQSVTQKKHINATLYKESIELHSKEDDLFYNIRKIKANEGFNFDRGNSGSPVICKNSGKVIAMISNKEGSNIGYAVDIANLKEVWKQMPDTLLQKSKVVIEPVSGLKEEVKVLQQKIETPSFKKKSSLIKYILFTILLTSIYITYKHDTNNPPPVTTSISQNIDIIINNPKLSKSKKANKLEEIGFKALVQEKYKEALEAFTAVEKVFPSFHSAREIRDLLQEDIKQMNNPTIRRKVLRKITTKYYGYIPPKFLKNLKEQERVLR